MASVDPEASARDPGVNVGRDRVLGEVTWLTPVEATTAGRPASKAGRPPSRCHPASPASKSTGNEPQPLRNAEAEFDQALFASRPEDQAGSTSNTSRREAISGLR